MTAAKKLEADQWIGTTVFSAAKRAGIPKHRIMSMRRILTWKKVEGSDGAKAKARLVVKGFTDPDLTTIRAESPTLPNTGRNSPLQMAASYRMRISMGDAKTAIPQGVMGGSERNIYGDVPPDTRGIVRNRR